MQRPVRIVVFGVICLIVGGCSGLNNLGTLSQAVVGPSSVDPDQLPQGMGALGEMTRDAAAAAQQALSDPVYRALLGVESLASGVMAGVLVAAGIGLLRDRLWSLRLARYWAWFSLVAAAGSVVLQALYVVPHSSTAMPGMGLAGAACTLPMLWLFPVLLLTLLGRPVVTDYLRWRAQQGHGPAYTAQSPPQAAPRPGVTNPTPASRPPTATGKPPQSGVAPPEQTWRDDPWNDPESR